LEIPKKVNSGKLPTNAATKFKSAPNKTGRKPAWLLTPRQNRTAFTGHYWVRAQIRRAFGSPAGCGTTCRSEIGV
jgi:hypothetical protein